jgi:dipeptidyl aminopeptidase/acylaminoacyl peptidase
VSGAGGVEPGGPGPGDLAPGGLGPGGLEPAGLGPGGLDEVLTGQDGPAGAGTPFDDLARYVEIPRVGGLRLAPDGTWLAAVVQTLSDDRKKYVSSIWRLPAHLGDGTPPRRLTWSADGEKNPRFAPDGSLLYISKRPGQQAASGDGKAADQATLWRLPAGGGEAVRVAALPGGVSAAETATASDQVVLTAPVLPGPDSGAGSEGDAERRQAREDAGVTAILHESVPVRYWDHDLGPAELRLFAVSPGVAGSPGDEAATPRDLTPAPGRALDQQTFTVAPDGRTVVTSWRRWDSPAEIRSDLVAIDAAGGDPRTLLSAEGFDFEGPEVAPDGTQLACIRTAHHTPEAPGDVTIVLTELTARPAAIPVTVPSPAGTSSPASIPVTVPSPTATPGTPSPVTTSSPSSPGGTGRDLLAGFDRRPAELAWAPDSAAVYFAADDQGRRPVYRVDLASGQVIRITGDDGAYTDLSPSPDGRYLFALRSSVDEPPIPVRLEAAEGQKPARLASPGGPLTRPGHLTEIEAAADDGTPIRSWLVLPHSASVQNPAPLLLWVHGGPMSSWNSWSWRWNPWLMAARGYAVLLPDPALSTGYGQDFITRAYRQWGDRPYADVMAATDAALARPDIDGSRTAMMGGSYGGYLANWIAGHTDRFDAIVSHAGLWMLDQVFGTTDAPMFWRPQFGDPLTTPERYEQNSPHRHVASIRTPMLVIHGNQDFRVPVGEALRLWWDLNEHGAEAKFLYFPDENHWILTPGHATVWYETVFAFLAQHVLGQPWRRPDLL